MTKNSAVISWDEFLDEGIMKEAKFRTRVAEIDWSQYKNKNVIIRGCSAAPIPTWVYMVMAAHLAPYARHILYGEPRRAVSIFRQSEP